MKKPLVILANCPVDPNSMGGGDRIAWEGFGKLGSSFQTEVWGCQEALGQAKKTGISLPARQISSFAASRFGIIGAYLLRILFSFFQKIELPKNSIVYSASEFLPDLVLPLRCKLKKIPFFWAIGFYLVAKPPGSPENPWSLKGALFYLAQRLSILIVKKTADRIYVLAQADKEALQKRGIASEKIELIRGGINLSDFQNIKKSQVAFEGVFVGRFHPQKGIADLLEVWERVSHRLPKARLAIIGWGDQRWVRLIQKSSERIGKERIVFLGFKDKQEKLSILKAGQVFVFPSHYESWGIVTLEAMASGLPVVAYDIPGLPSEIKQRAVLIPMFNKVQMAEEIVSLLKGPKRRLALAAAGRQISQKFGWESLRKKLAKELRYA